MVLTSSLLQYLVRQWTRSSINKVGSKGPNKGWSVSRYSDMAFAAKPEAIGTEVQNPISSSSSRSPHELRGGSRLWVGSWAGNGFEPLLVVGGLLSFCVLDDARLTLKNFFSHPVSLLQDTRFKGLKRGKRERMSCHELSFKTQVPRMLMGAFTVTDVSCHPRLDYRHSCIEICVAS